MTGGPSTYLSVSLPITKLARISADCVLVSMTAIQGVFWIPGPTLQIAICRCLP